MLLPLTLVDARVASTKRFKDAGSSRSQSYGCD
jgi:hypothetical protein